MRLLNIKSFFLSVLCFISTYSLEAMNKSAGDKVRDSFLFKLGFTPKKLPVQSMPVLLLSKANSSVPHCSMISLGRDGTSQGGVLSLSRPRAVTVDNAFLFRQADHSRREELLRRNFSVNFIELIGCESGIIDWYELLSNSHEVLAIAFMDQLDSELGKINWPELLDLSAQELDFCLKQSYALESISDEAKISFFWLHCYGYGIFPLLKKALIAANYAVQERSGEEALAQSLATYLSISDVAQLSNKKKVRLCQFIDELSNKLTQLMAKEDAGEMVRVGLQKLEESDEFDETDSACDLQSIVNDEDFFCGNFDI